MEYYYSFACHLCHKCFSLSFIHVTIFWFSIFRHKKQKEEDIAICECQYDSNNPDSACGDRCLNVLTSTECTPGYCPCGIHCKNQVGGSF